MFKPKWIQHTWDLSEIPDESEIGAIKGDLRLAEKADEEACLNVIQHSLMTERAWGADIDRFLEEYRVLFSRCFGKDAREEIVVWEDGRRLVGVSSLTWEADSMRQLVSGVCVFEEYRCRGGGKALLLRSLNRLKEHGLGKASVVTREGMTASKFLYLKFGSKKQVLDEFPSWEVMVAR